MWINGWKNGQMMEGHLYEDVISNIFYLELMQFSPIEIDAIQLSRSGSLASFNDVSQDKQSNII